MKTFLKTLAIILFFALNINAQRTSPQISSRNEPKQPPRNGNSNTNEDKSNEKPNLFAIKRQILAVEKQIEKNKDNEAKNKAKVISTKKSFEVRSKQSEDAKQINSIEPLNETILIKGNQPQSAILQNSSPQNGSYTIVKIKRTYACAILKGAYFTSDRRSNFTPINVNIQDQIDEINNSKQDSDYKLLRILLDSKKSSEQNYICLDWNLDGCTTEKAQLFKSFLIMYPYDFWDLKNKKYYNE